MGLKNMGYMKIQCKDCGRYIGRNNYESLHLPKCKPYLERKLREEIEQVTAAPILSLNMRQARLAGRYEEWEIAVREFINE